jgi:hypothetical protein
VWGHATRRLSGETEDSHAADTQSGSHATEISMDESQYAEHPCWWWEFTEHVDGSECCTHRELGGDSHTDDHSISDGHHRSRSLTASKSPPTTTTELISALRFIHKDQATAPNILALCVNGSGSDHAESHSSHVAVNIFRLGDKLDPVYALQALLALIIISVIFEHFLEGVEEYLHNKQVNSDRQHGPAAWLSSVRLPSPQT